MNADLTQLCINTVRILSADAVQKANSGHPGSITSVHASSADLAFEQLSLLVKQSRSGGDLPRPEIKTLLILLVDIVVQFGIVGRLLRFATWVRFSPDRLALSGIAKNHFGAFWQACDVGERAEDDILREIGKNTHPRKLNGPRNIQARCHENIRKRLPPEVERHER